MIANIGNFHTLAFRLGPGGIEGIFEHHTGLLTLNKLESLLYSFADGGLSHDDVFGDHGHGALIYEQEPLAFDDGGFNLVVTGPRRGMFDKTGDGEGETIEKRRSPLRPYFPAPFGDMMITGCFGLLAAVADVYPDLAGPIKESLGGSGGSGTPPWEISP